jgi:hypothetical protein
MEGGMEPKVRLWAKKEDRSEFLFLGATLARIRANQLLIAGWTVTLHTDGAEAPIEPIALLQPKQASS